VSRPYSAAFKRKMITQLIGKDAVSAHVLGNRSGIPQVTLSRWLSETRTLPAMAHRKNNPRPWSIDEKVRILAEAAKLTGAELNAFLEREGVLLGELQQWREALDEDGKASRVTYQQMRKLERELARKDKALAEAAALLILKKKVHHLLEDEDDDTDEGTEP
jgi:transposase